MINFVNQFFLLIPERASRVPQSEQISVLLSSREIAPGCSPGLRLLGMYPLHLGQMGCVFSGISFDYLSPSKSEAIRIIFFLNCFERSGSRVSVSGTVFSRAPREIKWTFVYFCKFINFFYIGSNIFRPATATRDLMKEIIYITSDLTTKVKKGAEAP